MTIRYRRAICVSRKDHVHRPEWARRAAPLLAGPGTTMSDSDFARLLEAQIPRLRRYARVLTRDATRADDLVQNCLVCGLAKQHLWQRGTDLRAWLFTILHNQYVNDTLCTLREGARIASEPALSPIVVPDALASLQLRDLERAIAILPEEQRQALLLVGLEGMRYEEVAKILDTPVGTVRSRLSRGRRMLRKIMEGGLGMTPHDQREPGSARRAA